MSEYIKVVSKQRPAKRAFDMQVGAHLRVYIAGKISGDKNYREKFSNAEQALTAMGHCVLNPAQQNKQKKTTTKQTKERRRTVGAGLRRENRERGCCGRPGPDR